MCRGRQVFQVEQLNAQRKKRDLFGQKGIDLGWCKRTTALASAAHPCEAKAGTHLAFLDGTICGSALVDFLVRAKVTHFQFSRA